MLLVDGDRERCEVLAEALASSEVTSFRVVGVWDSFETALEKLRSHLYHVVLLDLDHPDTRGHEGLVAIRDTRPDVAIVVFSGTPPDENVLLALKLGAEDYLLRSEIGTGAAVRATRFAALRKHAEVGERRADFRYRQLFRTSLDGILVVEEGGSILEGNAAALELLGITAGEVGSADFLDFLADDAGRERVRAALDSPAGTAGAEVRLRASDQKDRTCLLSSAGYREKGEAGAVRLLVLRDITERKRMEEQLAHDALHDALTGLPNRILFMDRIGQIQARRRRNPAHDLSVLFVDLDRFKGINDGFGHAAGDELLRRVAAMLESSVRSEDTVARMGGDEFAVALDGSGIEAACETAERILTALRRLRLPDDLPATVTASIGIAPADPLASSVEGVLGDADTAMYRAKTTGRGRWQVFDPVMNDEMRHMLSLEADLSEAISREEMELFYQPIFGAENGALLGFEALVRWKHATRGLLPARSFIPLAEEHGLIVDLGEWVLREACEQVREWSTAHGEGAGFLSVNVSFKQFMQPDLVERIEEILRTTGADPERIRLELTETTLMRDTRRTHTMLTRLRDLGLQLWVDDFGTGYSSLAQLQRLPVSALKIERSFVEGLGLSRGDGADEIVRLIASLAHTLGLETVAEGVETDDQLRRLREIGMGGLQGFLFSRPVPREDAEAMIREGRGATLV